MRVIAYSSPFVPAEWIEAHGLRPRRVVPVRRPADAGSAEGMCPYALGVLDTAKRARGLEGWVLTTSCDPMRRSAELLAMRLPVPVFLFNLPSTWESPTGLRMYASELRRLGRFLVECGGRHPDDGALRRVMERHDRERRATEPVAGQGHRSGIRVGLVGGPLCRVDREIRKVLATRGGRVVLDGTESGERCRPAPFRAKGLGVNPVRELTRSYFLGIPDVFQRPNSRLHEWVLAEVRDRRVEGVIAVHYEWCDLWRAETQPMSEWLPVPLLSLDLTGEGLTASQRTRIEAFMEALR